MNIKSLLHKSTLELHRAGIYTPELDARVLLEYCTGKKSSFIFSHPENKPTISQKDKFLRAIKRRKRGEPIAYITGHKEFYGYDFFVDNRVLIPRPESEWLVEEAVQFIKSKNKVIEPIFHLDYKPASSNYAKRIRRKIQKLNPINILDAGTGSGCLIIAIEKELEKLDLSCSTHPFGFDNSNRGLVVAKINARKLKAKNIVFLNSNLFSNRRIKNKIFDLVLANLPYVPREKKIRNPKSDLRQAQIALSSSRMGEIQNKKGIDFEPQDAIFANDNGTAVIKRFLSDATCHTKPGSVMLLELDPRNAKALLDFAKKEYPNAKVDLRKDLASLDRYLTIYL